MDLGRDQLRDYPRSSRVEWLIANGEGAYAMGTAAGANTRRYHALLVAPYGPDGERHVLLPRVEESVFVHGRWLELGSCQYPFAVHPAGFELLHTFSPDPVPRWEWNAEGIMVRRTVELLRHPHGVRISYLASEHCPIRVRIFTATRGYHTLGTGSDSPLQFTCPDACWEPVEQWYENVEYHEEMERGFPFKEDLWCPGSFTGEPGMVLTASLGEIGEPCTQIGASAFVSRRNGVCTLNAGYPWFTDWGRDTFISMPALLIGQGRLMEAKEVFEGFLQNRNQGLLPNHFADRAAEPVYNSADATLWAFEAAQRLWEAGDQDWVREVFYPAAEDIIRWHVKGTLHGIGVDPADGLLSAGYPNTQLTWMDARVGGVPVTPRHGKAVEINALWHNALRLMATWAGEFGGEGGKYLLMAKKTARNFSTKFWHSEAACCWDVIGDPAIRPNQIFAAALTHPLLDRVRRRRMLRTVRTHLGTPYGLRTLSPADPNFQARYDGGPAERDNAYHQGTVWPWLAAPFALAWSRNFEESFGFPELEDELRRGCLGQLNEIYDGTAPFTRRGAPAQAWSLAALFTLRAASLSL